jgi:hypothetical protein
MAPAALAEIRSHVARRLRSAMRQQCREGRCKLGLEAVPAFVLLKGELVRPNERMCDCIIFLGSPSPAVVLAELKGRTVHAREVGEKLRNAAKAVADIIGECPSFGAQLGFLPITLAKQWTRSELKALGMESVMFAGVKHDIRHARCGARLSDLLKKI